MLCKKEVDKKLGYALAAVAAATGFADNLRYAQTLQIKPSEIGRYLKKTANISICYAGFAQRFSFDQARSAGHAAFLTCAYDVVTDWGKPKDLQSSFASIIRVRASPELANMGLDLLNRDVRGVLDDDGLERGVTTLEFLLRMMNIREVFDRKCDIRRLGLNLQIIDDVIDWEDDSVKGDWNCLANTELREVYLKHIQEDFDDLTLRKLFPYGSIPIYVIRKTQRKASDMLTSPEKYFP